MWTSSVASVRPGSGRSLSAMGRVCARRDIARIPLTIGARIGAIGVPGQVLVSSTVKDLVAGSGLVFQDVGEHDLEVVRPTAGGYTGWWSRACFVPDAGH